MLIKPALLQRAGLFACALSLLATSAPALAAPVARPAAGSPAQPAALPAARPDAHARQVRATVAAYTVLHSFTGTDGANPAGNLLIDVQGNLYGTTAAGGANNAGTIFEATSAGALTTLHAFTGPDGSQPGGGLLNLIGDINLGGPLYGVTASGGANGLGTVYQVGAGGSIVTLHSFAGAADGKAPNGTLIRFIDGNLYGTTSSGGAFGAGTIFKLTSAGTLTTLYSFTGGADGGSPVAGLAARLNGFSVDGSLYGVAASGGAAGAGTIFSISPAGAFRTIYSFNPSADGAQPSAELITDLRGNLFGTTAAGGPGQAGTLFQLDPANGFAVRYAFPTDPVTGLNPKGAVPQARLSLFINGAIYGTTSFGGDAGAGVVFKFAGSTLTVLHSFAGSDGANPAGKLIPTFNGNLYGTTTGGGTANNGVLYVLPQ